MKKILPLTFILVGIALFFAAIYFWLEPTAPGSGQCAGAAAPDGWQEMWQRLPVRMAGQAESFSRLIFADAEWLRRHLPIALLEQNLDAVFGLFQFLAAIG